MFVGHGFWQPKCLGHDPREKSATLLARADEIIE
jgi:hypothetical protein